MNTIDRGTPEETADTRGRTTRLLDLAESVGVVTMLNKVPEVTVFFWIVKVLATTVGETGADLLSVSLNWGLTVTTWFMTALLVVALIVQFRTRRYVPSSYWTVVVLVSVVGTLFTDNLVDNFGVPLWVTTALFALALVATFTAWFVSERTLSIHSIVTSKREALYWLAILFTFALGTAAGDFLSEGLNLGYAVAVLVFAGMIGVVVVARYAFKLNVVLSFWLAYILTRPLGASIGDLLSQAPKDGGLGLGTIGTSALFLVVIVAVVAYFTSAERTARRVFAAEAVAA
ncbi:MAG: hypothetical protein ABIX44_08045 [Cryobacterium sp.]